jgi:hypothetical protein
MKSCGAITLRPRPECGTAIGRKPWCHCRKAFFQRAIEHVNANVEEALDGVPVRSHLLLLHPFDWQTISLTADSTKPVEIRRPARYRPGNSCPGSTHGVVIHRSARQLVCSPVSIPLDVHSVQPRMFKCGWLGKRRFVANTIYFSVDETHQPRQVFFCQSSHDYLRSI